jgi:hypothetical protein
VVFWFDVRVWTLCQSPAGPRWRAAEIGVNTVNLLCGFEGGR